MPWYAAHAIMYVRFKRRVQKSFPLWENVLLIEAPDRRTATRKARRRAKRDEGDSGGTFTWDSQPATWIFGGIRKLVSVSHEGDGVRPANGDEISYSELEVPDARSLQRLVAGKDIAVRYVE